MRTLAKYLAKALNGYHHSKGFTLQDFHEPILIKARNAPAEAARILAESIDYARQAERAARALPPGPAGAR